MSKLFIEDSTLTAIADGFRTSRGITDKISTERMAELAAVPIGGGGSNKLAQIIERTVTEITAEDLPGVTTIGSYAFSNCSLLSKLELPNSIKSVGIYSFNGCAAIEEIVLPDSIEELNTSCFYNCSKLKKVIFNKGISKISHQAFNRCVALQELDFTKCTFVPELLNVNAFGSVPTTCVIKVPATLYDEWKAATNWSNYADYMAAV